jgi:hypothetical protein
MFTIDSIVSLSRRYPEFPLNTPTSAKHPGVKIALIKCIPFIQYSQVTVDQRKDTPATAALRTYIEMSLIAVEVAAKMGKSLSIYAIDSGSFLIFNRQQATLIIR